MLRPSGPGAPRFCATSSNAQIRFPSFVTGVHRHRRQGLSERVSRLGTAYRTEGAGWPVSVPGTAPCGLSAVSGNRSRGLPVRWPWSPSLAAGCARVGPPFDGLPVLRDHPTPLVSSSSCRWFLDDYRASRGSREVSSGKHTELGPDAVAYTPACPTDMGFTAVGQLTPGLDASHSASLSLGSGLASSDSTGRPLAGGANCERPCLVDGGFPPSGPQEDLTTTCLTSLFCVHAEHTKACARCAQPLRGLDPPSAQPRRGG